MDKTNVTKPSRQEDIRRDNTAFLIRLLASVKQAVETRTSAGTFGEITVKISQHDGRIMSAKVLEETILRPEDST
jgi:hypothetical protein